MTDITELAQSLKAAAIDAKELAIIARYSKGRAAAEKFYALANPNNVIELVEALEKAQQVDEELCRLLPPGAEYMDPPDGGSVTPLEQVRRMIADYRQRIAELESRTVKIPGWFVKDAIAVYDRDEIEEAPSAAGIGKGVMLQHQMQPTFNTCMATCVAMVAGQPVDEVVERWHQKFHDRTDWLDDALDYYKIPYFYGSQRKAELLYGFIYFLTVPSLNIKGGLHQILMSLTAERGIEVFDPAMGRPGSKYYVWGEAQNDDQFGVISWCVDLSVPVVQQKGED